MRMYLLDTIYKLNFILRGGSIQGINGYMDTWSVPVLGEAHFVLGGRQLCEL